MEPPVECPGSRDNFFFPQLTKERDPVFGKNKSVLIHNISRQPAYWGWSQEEIRWADMQGGSATDSDGTVSDARTTTRQWGKGNKGGGSGSDTSGKSSGSISRHVRWADIKQGGNSPDGAAPIAILTFPKHPIEPCVKVWDSALLNQGIGAGAFGPGSKGLELVPFIDNDGDRKGPSHFKHISAMPELSGWSPEELRWADLCHQQGVQKTHTAAVAPQADVAASVEQGAPAIPSTAATFGAVAPPIPDAPQLAEAALGGAGAMTLNLELHAGSQLTLRVEAGSSLVVHISAPSAGQPMKVSLSTAAGPVPATA